MIISLRCERFIDNERAASLVPALVQESWSFRTFWCTCHKEGHMYTVRTVRRGVLARTGEWSDRLGPR